MFRCSSLILVKTQSLRVGFFCSAACCNTTTQLKVCIQNCNTNFQPKTRKDKRSQCLFFQLSVTVVNSSSIPVDKAFRCTLQGCFLSTLTSNNPQLSLICLQHGHLRGFRHLRHARSQNSSWILSPMDVVASNRLDRTWRDVQSAGSECLLYLSNFHRLYHRNCIEPP